MNEIKAVELLIERGVTLCEALDQHIRGWKNMSTEILNELSFIEFKELFEKYESLSLLDKEETK